MATIFFYSPMYWLTRINFATGHTLTHTIQWWYQFLKFDQTMGILQLRERVTKKDTNHPKRQFKLCCQLHRLSFVLVSILNWTKKSLEGGGLNFRTRSHPSFFWVRGEGKLEEAEIPHITICVCECMWGEREK